METKKVLVSLVVISTIFAIAYSTIRYLIWKGIVTQNVVLTQIKFYGKYALIILAAGTFLFFVISYFLRGRKKESILRELVPTQRALDIWLPEFVMRTGIPYSVMRTKEGEKIIPAHKNAIEIRKTHAYSTPKTANKFFKFEVVAKEGNKRGVNSVQIQLDLGEEHIIKNWNAFIVENTPINLLNYDDRKYPLATPEDEEKRMIFYRIEKMEEGYEENELKQVDELINKQQIQKKEKVREEAKIDQKVEEKIAERAEV